LTRVIHGGGEREHIFLVDEMTIVIEDSHRQVKKLGFEPRFRHLT